MSRKGDVVVSEATGSDVEALLDLYLGFYSELRSRQGWRPHDREECREEVERYLSRDRVFLAEAGGEPVGFVRVSERDDSYWIEEIYVRPEYRGMGVGRALVEKAEDYVRKRDSYAYVMVLPQDRRAMGFWFHMGYRLFNSVELAKSLEGVGGPVWHVPLLGSVLEMRRWAREDYGPLERRFLELAEEFLRRGGGGEELLKVFVEALEGHLSGT
jgi:GNAT superfamily N-acetyltransferase